MFILVSKLRNFLRFGDTIVKFRRVPLTNRQGGLDPFGLVFGVLDGVLSYASVLRTIVFYALGVSRYRIEIDMTYCRYLHLRITS